MSTRLDLPPERDLPASRRRAIRVELVAATRAPHRRRRPWLVVAPLAALVTVLAVVLGLTRPWDPAPPVVGVPSASPSPSESIDWSVGHGRQPLPNPALPSAAKIERGPLDAGSRARAIARCQADLDRRTRVAAVHLARRTSTDGDVVLFTGRDGMSYACSKHGASVYAGNGSKTGPVPAPSRRRPVVRISSPGLGGSRAPDGSASGRSDAPYRVGPEVASLQMRVTVEGRTGPWFEASLEKGYAWASASVTYEATRRGAPPRDFTVEDRAFDDQGHELAIDRTPR